MKKEKKVWKTMDGAETVISSQRESIENIYVSATKLQNMIKEMTLKVSLYNLFRRLA